MSGSKEIPCSLFKIVKYTLNQAYAQLAEKYGCSSRTIKRRLDAYTALQGRATPGMGVVVMEMGRGFCFESRQKRILIDRDYFKADLIFYHCVLKCHVIIDLKCDRMEKGKCLIDCDYHVTSHGLLHPDSSALQCLYAPEFRATSHGQRMTVTAS